LLCHYVSDRHDNPPDIEPLRPISAALSHWSLHGQIETLKWAREEILNDLALSELVFLEQVAQVS
jgi:hypothetical protein